MHRHVCGCVHMLLCTRVGLLVNENISIPEDLVEAASLALHVYAMNVCIIAVMMAFKSHACVCQLTTKHIRWSPLKCIQRGRALKEKSWITHWDLHDS